MVKFKVVYKCPLCGLVVDSEGEYEIADDVLPDLFQSVWGRNVIEKYGIRIPRFIMHPCDESHWGVCYISGFNITSKEERTSNEDESECVGETVK